MEETWEQRRAAWLTGRAVAASRARWTVYALVATAASRVFLFAADETREENLIALGALAQLVLIIATAIVFLRWLAHAVSFGSSISRVPLRWRASTAVWSFFMPVVSLWRPYQVIRDLNELLAPDAVPEPAPQPILDGSGGYREVRMKVPPPPRALPHVSIGAWWGAFIIARVIGRVTDSPGTDSAGTVLTVISAALAVFVVRAIDARMAERYRRLSHASDAELDAWHLRA